MKNIVLAGLSSFLLSACYEKVEKPIEVVVTAPFVVAGAAVVAPPMIVGFGGLYAMTCIDGAVPRSSDKEDRFYNISVTDHLNNQVHQRNVQCEHYYHANCGNVGPGWRWRPVKGLEPIPSVMPNGKEFDIDFSCSMGEAGAGAYAKVLDKNKKWDHSLLRFCDSSKLPLGQTCYADKEKTKPIIKYTYQVTEIQKASKK